jgi:hypothetical protein
MPMRKVPVGWTTGPGGVGVSVFYTPFGSDATVELGAFFTSLRPFFPTAVTWSVPGSGDVVDETSGLITGAWTAGTASTQTGTVAGAYVGGTGCYVRWQTAGIVSGRRVRGRTFLCPMPTGQFDANGTITDASITSINGFVTTLVGSGKLLIWHRPTTPGGTDGSSHAVIAGSVLDKVTSLRTRRT